MNRRPRAVRRPLSASDDRGVTLVLAAMLITALFVIVALVIDFGLVRQNRQSDKSATDFAAAAGIRALDDATGQVRTWPGICAARDFLVANNEELSPLSHVDSSGNPVADPCTSPSASPCGTDPATWGTYFGLADSGRVRVTIQNGYDLSTSGFSEDSDEYGNDPGDGPCDHLAVIIEEREDVYFGGVAGATSYDTTIRSVARLVQGTEGDTVAALVLLERVDCQALDVSGTGETIVRVEGKGLSPGAIHADSLGNGASCNRTIFDVDGTVDQPRIFVGRAEATDPDTGLIAPGLISSRSLSGDAGAIPTNTSLGTDWVCAQVESSDCLGAGGGSGPTARGLIGRSRVDARYREPIVDLRQEAATRFSWDTAIAAAAGFETHACNTPTTDFTASRVFIGCAGNQAFDGTGRTFSASVDEVVINGDVSLSGALRFHSPAKVYIRGHAGGPNTTVSLTNGTALRVNDGDDGSCEDRYGAAPSARTKLVIGTGRIGASGGVLRLCQTTLLLMDSSGSTPCPVPGADGAVPYDNTCAGNVSVSGQAVVDWTAPNVKNEPDDLPTAADFAELEDLALWSESSGSGGSAWSVVGGGGLRLSGVFFTPNANPLSIGGGGSIDIQDAQIITRKLNVSGGGVLSMQPEAHNSVLIPVLGGFALVR